MNTGGNGIGLLSPVVTLLVSAKLELDLGHQPERAGRPAGRRVLVVDCSARTCP